MYLRRYNHTGQEYSEQQLLTMPTAEKSSADFITAAESALASQDDAARKQLLGAAMRATAMLEAPLDTVWRMIMSVSIFKSHFES